MKIFWIPTIFLKKSQLIGKIPEKGKAFLSCILRAPEIVGSPHFPLLYSPANFPLVDKKRNKRKTYRSDTIATESVHHLFRLLVQENLADVDRQQVFVALFQSDLDGFA